MSVFLSLFLIVHVISGVIGIFLFGGAALNALKQKPSFKTLKWFSFLGFLALMISWTISGGYYYVTYYGKAVKPIIQAGATPWIHSVIMETKEHIFLFLPFLALLATLIFWLYGESLAEKPKLKSAVAVTLLLITIIGIAVILAGISISGTASR
mgnify:CR=1 FL=1